MEVEQHMGVEVEHHMEVEQHTEVEEEQHMQGGSGSHTSDVQTDTEELYSRGAFLKFGVSLLL